jgi:hypothetical protein
MTDARLPSGKAEPLRRTPLYSVHLAQFAHMGGFACLCVPKTAHTKIAESTITAQMETPLQPDDKSNAKLKKSIAPKIETPQPSPPDGTSC